jgi:hypothetical protein
VTESLLLWSIEESAGFDSAWAALDLERRTLAAEGHADGQRPEPYSLAYTFESGPDWITKRMHVRSRTATGSRELELRRTPAGWTVDGRERQDLADALDCDLGLCPLTNTMPILRHGLLEPAASVELLMAFIRVPSLEVVANRQRYTHVRRLPGGGALIRYESGTFRSDLTIDPDGFVVDYPQLGHRLAPPSGDASPT